MLAFLCIATLLNSNIPHDDLISFLNKVESTSLKQYLRYLDIKKLPGYGNYDKRKRDLIN